MRTIIPKNAKLVPEKAQKVFSGYIFDTYQWHEEMFDGSQGTFEMLKRPDTLQVIAIKDGKIIILDEEQPFFGKFMGLPGGRHDHEPETELDAAKRELAEETGMLFKTWKLVEVTQPTDKIEQFVYFFLATDYEATSGQKLDAGEKINVLECSLEEVKDLHSKGNVRILPEILFRATSIEELLSLPEYQAS